MASLARSGMNQGSWPHSPSPVETVGKTAGRAEGGHRGPHPSPHHRADGTSRRRRPPPGGPARSWRRPTSRRARPLLLQQLAGNLHPLQQVPSPTHRRREKTARTTAAAAREELQDGGLPRPVGAQQGHTLVPFNPRERASRARNSPYLLVSPWITTGSFIPPFPSLS
jgi:hypothetical protein